MQCGYVGPDGNACQAPSTSQCTSCGGQVCQEHTRQGEAGTICLKCEVDQAQAAGLCLEKVGFLTLRDCKQPASATCTGCGHPLCGKHAKVSERGVLCARCAKQAGVKREDDDDVSGYYYRGYRPYYWGSDYDYYDDDYLEVYSFDSGDVEVFEEHAGEVDSYEGGVESDFDGS